MINSFDHVFVYLKNNHVYSGHVDQFVANQHIELVNVDGHRRYIPYGNIESIIVTHTPTSFADEGEDPDEGGGDDDDDEPDFDPDGHNIFITFPWPKKFFGEDE